MTRIHELIVYRNFENGQILEDMAWIFDHAGSEYYNEEDLRGLYYECIHGLVDLAGTYGFEGNLTAHLSDLPSGEQRKCVQYGQ